MVFDGYSHFINYFEYVSNIDKKRLTSKIGGAILEVGGKLTGATSKTSSCGRGVNGKFK
jgi:hypothetical protein